MPVTPKLTFSVALSLVIAASAPAIAQPTRPIQFDLGASARFGSPTRVLMARTFIGYYQNLVTLGEESGLFVSVGALGEWGVLTIDRGEEISNYARYALGPMARFGFAAGEGDSPDLLVYGGAAAQRASASNESNSPETPEFDGAWGVQFSFGVGWPGSWHEYSERISSGGCDGGGCAFKLFYFLLPNTIEFVSDGPGGASIPTRYGLYLGWSL